MKRVILHLTKKLRGADGERVVTQTAAVELVRHSEADLLGLIVNCGSSEAKIAGVAPVGELEYRCTAEDEVSSGTLRDLSWKHLTSGWDGTGFSGPMAQTYDPPA